MHDPFDIDLHDDELGAEILLLTQLMVAASESAGPLSQAAIDAILTSPTTGGAAAHHSNDPGTPDTLAATTGDSDIEPPSHIIPEPRTRVLCEQFEGRPRDVAEQSQISTAQKLA